MGRIYFNRLHDNRRNLIVENQDKDHIVFLGSNNILISAPHGVSQVRLGRLKHSERGSLATALYLHQETNSHFIAKTRNNNDDANFDDVSIYKDTARKIIKEQGIKYFIDFHGLAAHWPCDINLGTHLGNNISDNKKVLNDLHKLLKNNGFSVLFDQPFMAGSQTLSGSLHNELGIWSLQIEINCAITNLKENFHRYELLLSILRDWILSL